MNKNQLKSDDGLDELRQYSRDKGMAPIIEDQQEEIDRLQTVLNTVRNPAKHILELDADSNAYSFGLIGDSHVGSIYDRMDDLGNFYKICKAKGITKILHAGDVLDGHGIYRGQEFEQYNPGLDAQLERLDKKYPQEDTIETAFITGNHDLSYNKQVGIKIGDAIINKRQDFKFIGDEYGMVVFNTPSGRKFVVALKHPGGGTAYAISYKLQKIIDSLAGGTKPSILGVGHYHKAEMLPVYRNLAGFQVGCFQSQTPHMAAMPTPAHVGGWIIRFTVGTKQTMCNMIQAQFIAYY